MIEVWVEIPKSMQHRQLFYQISRNYMKIKNIIVIGLILSNFGCVPLTENQDKTSPATKLDEYKDVNFSNLYEKDRSFQALETGIIIIIDGILTSSKDDTHLSEKKSKLLEEYVRQNRLFCQTGFDQKWMSQLKENLDLVEKTENNLIASTVNKKMQRLFSERQC